MEESHLIPTLAVPWKRSRTTKLPGEFYTRGKWPAGFIKKATERQGLHLKVFVATELVRGADKLTVLQCSFVQYCWEMGCCVK